MIDRFRLHVKGGDGGSGNASLHRSRNDRFGKPDGRYTLTPSQMSWLLRLKLIFSIGSIF